MKTRDKIRQRLELNHLSFVWLINQLEDRGIQTDKTEMSSVMSGTRKGKKAEAILTASWEVLNEYERFRREHSDTACNIAK